MTDLLQQTQEDEDDDADDASAQQEVGAVAAGAGGGRAVEAGVAVVADQGVPEVLPANKVDRSLAFNAQSESTAEVISGRRANKLRQPPN